MLRGPLAGCARLCSSIFVVWSIATASALAQEPTARPAVLVTGATSGIGLRTTEVLSNNGFFVYAGARDAADLARLDAMPNVAAVLLRRPLTRTHP